ncbi:DNA-binding CsgD family transcriptional regulator/energy-coupling factor transporter ATP-binding protein EcfA2 [Arthrobacter sp. CAN_A212]|uniref:helix-turn-helix transcriptional regulator n=1 Tax=unclassified Arthrobacter TaxID=235627 RepID=UPI0018CBC1F6|nr:LuxR family transcriptional regulator [Arthrobacter sp. CAN_C5]MBP2217749.1 DNA-binding CsgD family transcriptional regulator/energy-coupling factor transporter ATP-binding protein EcfA2 [Arthrobacter sp. CAN_C5]
MSFNISTHAHPPAPIEWRQASPEPRTGASSATTPPRGARAYLPQTLNDLLLEGSAPSSVLLTGESGSGKTALLRSMVDHLRATACLIHLRGSGRNVREPYGALRVLLADTGEHVLSHPVRVISALTRVLKGKALGLPVIVVVDDAHYLDEASTTVLGQMVQAGTIRLVAACSDLADAPVYFQTLSLKGTLVRMDLAPLSQQEVAAYLAATLGAGASRASSLALHTHSGGNPRLLGALVRDYVAAGALSCGAGVWVLTADKVRPSEATTALIADRIVMLQPAQRRLLGALAAAGTTPLAAVPGDALGDLDDLQEQGMLSIASDRWATVSVATPLLSDAVLGLTNPVDGFSPHLAASRSASGPLSRPVGEPRKQQAARILERARQAAAKGHFRDVVTELKSSEFIPGALEPDHRRLAAAWLCEALAFTGRVDDAKEAAVALHSDIAGQPPLPSRIAMTLATLEAVSGNLTGLLEVSAYHLLSLGPGTGTYEELAEGLIYAAAGRPAEAEPLLHPALRQLQVHDPAGAAPLAAAALAFVSAPDNPAQAADYLAIASIPSRTASWTVRRLTKHFAALALAGTASADRSAFELRELSREDAALGNSSWELMTLCGAMRQGDTGVAQPILKLSATCQGRFAALSQLYAKGVDAEDAELVLQAMELAQHLGDQSFARDAAASAVQLAAQSGERATIAYVADRVRGVVGVSGTALGARRQLASLTRREVEVVTAVVDGKTNRDLALAMDVSVRTVEGHLHRVYTKLHVRTRAELLAKVNLSTAFRR